ncbi:hypothetical protein LZ30DRAFT_339149 [Colletotrichum cereale]|nr:hypothetical protein LZ30DRAFT_339149 [Colletotrichum cereale]
MSLCTILHHGPVSKVSSSRTIGEPCCCRSHIKTDLHARGPVVVRRLMGPLRHLSTDPSSHPWMPRCPDAQMPRNHAFSRRRSRPTMRPLRLPSPGAARNAKPVPAAQSHVAIESDMSHSLVLDQREWLPCSNGASLSNLSAECLQLFKDTTSTSLHRSAPRDHAVPHAPKRVTKSHSTYLHQPSAPSKLSSLGSVPAAVLLRKLAAPCLGNSGHHGTDPNTMSPSWFRGLPTAEYWTTLRFRPRCGKAKPREHVANRNCLDVGLDCF